MQTYRGSLKHKNRPANGRKGTLCPEWTHAVGDASLGNSTFEHPWGNTHAHELFVHATLTPEGRRYATARGIAFEAKPTGDGTWHGYPVPWESVPPSILERWLQDQKVTRHDLRRHRHDNTTAIHWALRTDTP